MGRKPKDEQQRHVHGSRDRGSRNRRPAQRVPVEMPADLPDAQQVIWKELAPHATEQGTLVPATASALRHLCAAVVARDQMAEAIEHDGLTFQKITVDGSGQEHSELKAHPLISQHRGMMQRVEAGLVRFRLSPIGKEIAPLEEPEDPFEEFSGPVN